MISRRAAVLAAMLALAPVGHVTAQVPMTGQLPDFDSAPPAPPPGTAPQGAAPGAPPGPSRGTVSVQPTPQGAAPMPGGFAGAGPPGGAPPCFQDFMPLRQEAEKRAGLIKGASDRKAPRQEVCQLFNRFADAEAKVVKFVTAKQSACGIPAEVVTQMKSNHDKTLTVRKQICSGGPMGAAPGAPAPPPTPKLSDELGFGRAPTPGATSTGGTFNTLTGNPIK
jgi:hypothetical protein